MDNKINKKTILILIFMIIGVIIAGTFAWLSFRSKDTAMVLTVGQIDNVRITLSPYQIKSNMGSVLDYSSGTVTNIEAINNSSSSKKFKLYYKINTIDSNLAISSFKYTITRSTTKNGTYTKYGNDGSFAGTSSGQDLVILEETLTSEQTYYYKVYVWLDGNGNVSSASGKVFNGELRADILGHIVTFDANGGSVDISSKEVTTGLQYGELPTPTRKGYKFLGWHGKNIFNPRKMAISNTSFNSETEEMTFNSGVYDRIMNKAQWTPKTNSTYTIVIDITQNTFDKILRLVTDSRFYIEKYNNSTSINIPNGTVQKFVIPFTTKNDFSNVTLGSFWFQTSNSVTGTFKTKIAVYEDNELSSWEPYYITSDTTVVQDEDHTLTAIWEEANPVVTLNADGGTIPATSGWTVNGSTATKQVGYNGTYGNLPMPTRSGYTFLGWHGKNLINISNHNETFTNKYMIDYTSTPKYVLIASKQYTLSFQYIVENSTNNLFSSVGYGITGFSKDIKSSSQYYIVGNENNSGTVNLPFRVPENFDYNPPYVWFRFVRMYPAGNANVNISNIMLEEGTTATPYEPYYISSNTTVVQENNHTLTAMWQAN